MHPSEFDWAPAEEGTYKGNSTLNVEIGITEEGKFECRNHADPNQRESYDSPAELCEALQKGLESRASEIS